MNEKNYIKEIKGHSIFGISSLILACINWGIVLIYVYRFILWLIKNEAYKNPAIIQGIQIPKSYNTMITFLLVMVVIGFISGLIGFMGKKKLAAVIGITLNGILLLVYILKL